MSLTNNHQAKYFAYALTREGGQGVDRLQQSLLSASVDLNPHQVQAALFALRSPVSKGVLLADEVGLGKTIEAGLVLCQLWAERKRRLLVVCPASLRKQWQCELDEKFNLPSEILDARRYGQLQREGHHRPFEIPYVVITSYHFAAKMKEDIKRVQWACVAMDEAHKLRNAYRESNRIGQALRWALADRRKILLSATPLQNNLTELYGVSTLIDETVFGDLPTFRSRYANAGGDLDGLRERLREFCHRTLRKDVLAFVPYMERFPLTERFEGSETERLLYEGVSQYLQDTTAYAFPSRQRHMLTILIRKLLSSSPAALIGTLEKVLERLVRLQDSQKTPEESDEELLHSILEGEEDLLDEVAEDAEDGDCGDEPPPAEQETAIVVDGVRLQGEIERVRGFIASAKAIGTDSKTHHLLKALRAGWSKLTELKAAEKAVVFTESRRSMLFLKDFLEANGYRGEVVCYSGGGRHDPEADAIYEAYKELHPEDTAGKSVMIRHALIDHFRRKAKILIATEAGAEGINLQFCSMVVNYDLPWNPQRVEQRIGRCHRYGQKHDVVVVNFINTLNAADVRVFELLSEKLRLFEGVFGASNDVLGAIDQKGVSFESRVHAILQQCRTNEEITAAFDKLQSDCLEDIKTQREQTRIAVMENLDDDVRQHLRMDADSARVCLDEGTEQFWLMSRHVLAGRAVFDDAALSFRLNEPPGEGIVPGCYSLRRDDPADAMMRFRPNTALGEWAIQTAKTLDTPLVRIDFSISAYQGRISVLEQLKGQSGYLLVNLLHLESLDAEDFLLFSTVTDSGSAIEHDIARQFFKLPQTVRSAENPSSGLPEKLETNARQFASATANKVGEANNALFKEETIKLERWSEDQVAVVTHRIDTLKARKLEIERAIRQAESADAQFPFQRELDETRKAIRKARDEVNDVEDQTDARRKRLLDALQRKLVPAQKLETLFTIRWTIV